MWTFSSWRMRNIHVDHNLSVSRLIVRVLVLVFISFAWSEYFIFEWAVWYRCAWPVDDATHKDAGYIQNMLLFADPHILGNHLGHPFDRMRREWQMLRTFRAATSHLKPNLVAILGDVFDEGKWASDEEFSQYFSRYREIFSLDHLPERSRPEMLVTAGNHDIGFHYATSYPLWSRFDRHFNSSPVSHWVIGETGTKDPIHIIGINSMAFYGDTCKLCSTASYKMERLRSGLECARLKTSDACNKLVLKERSKYMKMTYTRPILLMHYPLFRKSDQICATTAERELEEYLEEPSRRSQAFKPDHDCLNRNASAFLLSTFEPRAIFSGHTHNGCLVYHKVEPGMNNERSAITDLVPEYSIPSMSWRNRNNPVLALLRLSSRGHSIFWCKMPEELTIKVIYSLAALALLCLVVREIFSCKQKVKSKSQ